MRISDWSSDVCSSDLPGLQRFPAGAFRLVAENVRMAADHLGGDRRHDVVNAEGATLLGDAGVVDDLKLEVAKLFLQVGHIAAADGIGDFIGFLDRVRSEEHTSELQSLMRISYADFC